MLTTTDTLITDIKLRGALPTASTLFTNARFLSLANSEFQTHILPLVMSARENFYEYDIDTTINATGFYPIHTRAYLGILSNAALIDDTRRFNLGILSEEHQVDTQEPREGNPGIVIKRNTVQLMPIDGSNYSTLRLSIFLRPGTFVLEEDSAQITAIDTGTNTLTFAASTIPSSWTTANTFDLIQGSAQYDTLDLDLSAGTVGATSIVMSSSLPSRLAVGDWISLAGETPIIQAPEAFSYLLSQRVANLCMQIKGDVEGAAAGFQYAAQMEENLMKSIQPRTQKGAKKMVSNNGMLRSSGYSTGW